MIAIGFFMITAAVLKGQQIAYFGVPQASLVRSLPLNIMLVIFEFLLGSWLITGLYGRVTRLVSIAFFFSLLQAALWLALQGRKSCGCFGHVDVNPWIAVAVDLAVLTGLVLQRAEGPEKTIRTHDLRFYGFLFAAVAIAVPGLMTMAVYKRDATRAFSYELRHDRMLHDTRVTVDLPQPTVEDLLALVATQTGAKLIIDDGIRQYVDACQPDWKTINHHTPRGWAALEAVSKRMPIPARWIKTSEGYALIGDNPIRRARLFWFTGMLTGAMGCCWLAWNSRRGRLPRGGSAHFDKVAAIQPPQFASLSDV